MPVDCLRQLASLLTDELGDDNPDLEHLDLETAPDWFHAGQLEAWNCGEEVVLLLCGAQSGKSVFLPWWLAREIQRCGPGAYGLNGPTLTLLKNKCIPEFVRVFGKVLKLGTYNKSDRIFTFSKEGIQKVFGTVDYNTLRERYGWRNDRGEIEDPEFEVTVQVFVGYATKPDSLESSTFKAVASDECGQPDFKLGSYEALQRRRVRYGGRHLMTTTPYDLGWLKTKIYDLAVSAGRPAGTKFVDGSNGTIAAVRFESWLNPTFGIAKFEKIRGEIAKWKFDLFYRAIFTRPAGAIYDTFDEEIDTYKPFRIPDHWKRAIGLDFGQTNTAAFFCAFDPDTNVDDPDIYVYRTYHTGGRDAYEHVDVLLNREPGVPPAVGGAPSEDEWRRRFSEAGMYTLRPTIGNVEPGIDAMYGKLKRHKLKISRKLNQLIGDFLSYSRELDAMGEPIPGTIANKHAYHRLDAGRYVVSEIDYNPTFWQVGESLVSNDYDSQEAADYSDYH